MSALLIRRNTCRFKDFRQRPASRFKPSTVPGGGGAEVGVSLQADNGEWYEINAFELSPGDASIRFGQSPVAPGPDAYLVIVNRDDGLNYKFILTYDAVDDVVTGGYDGLGATGEAETPTILTHSSGRQYQIHFETEGGVITFELEQV